MGQVLHGSATTTEAVRRAIQRSQESLPLIARTSLPSSPRPWMLGRGKALAAPNSVFIPGHINAGKVRTVRSCRTSCQGTPRSTS